MALPVKWPSPRQAGSAWRRPWAACSCWRAWTGTRGCVLRRAPGDHHRLRGRTRGRESPPTPRPSRSRTRRAGSPSCWPRLGHGPAGARRLDDACAPRPGARLRLRRAVRGRARLAHQARGGGRPLADRPPASGVPAADRHCRGSARRPGARRRAGNDGWRPDQRRADRRPGHGRPGERSRAGRGLIPRLLEPPARPGRHEAHAAGCGHAVEGLRLTARHSSSPALVTEAVEEFGWRDQLVGTLRQELDVFRLHTLRGIAQAEMGGVRRSRTSLVLTKTGELRRRTPPPSGVLAPPR